MKIATRIALFTLLGTGAILAAVVFSDYVGARRLLEGELRAKAKYLALATARDMEVIKRAVEKVVAQVVVSLETDQPPVDTLYRLLEKTVAEHQEIYGSAVVITGADGVVAIPYVHRERGGVSRKNLASGGYPFETFDWYQLPREMRRPEWTEPYFDEGGGDSLMVTYAAPILTADGERCRGLVTGDLALDWLSGMLAQLELGDGGKAFLLSRTGTVVSHPERELIMRESIFSLAEEYGKPKARRVGQDMIRGGTGFVEFNDFHSGEPSWLAYAPVPGPGWSLGTLFPQDQITAKVLAMSRLKILLGGLGVLGVLAVATLIGRSISRPIRELQAAAERLAGGNLDAPLPAPRGADEVARLTGSFSRMRDDLKRYIEDLKETTAAKARIENDLKTARTIQLDILPSRFTFDPPRPELEIYAMLDAAREVGGDFYDFFLAGQDRLFVAVGDVSGKGVPAAIFMAISKAYLKAFVSHGADPAEALRRLNDELAIENDEGLFLTVFCAAIDLKTGECVYANGGHNPPFVLRASGAVEPVPAVKGPLIGLEPGKRFESARLSLAPGDLLLVTSDGVVEAEDPDEALYGDERTGAVLAGLRGQGPRVVVEALRKDVSDFTREAPQSDDITLLAVTYRGPGGSR
jgi:sigma-B regulation protein RsbU (phosphoserine phosphatase)